MLGIYPMLPNETTNFIVIDFDDGDWQMDISAVRTVCKDHGISCAVERSRSGEAYFISGKLNMLMRAVNQCMMNGANVIVITKKADNAYAEKMRQMMAAHDIEHYIKNNIQSSFVVIDGKTVWYASGELFGTTEDECVLRIEDEVLAGELAHNIHDFKMLCF